MKRRHWGVAATLALLPGLASATGDVSHLELDDYDGLWSLGISYRSGTSPYLGDTRRTDLLPMISYSGERLFLAGSQGGVHLWRNAQSRWDLVAGFRFDGYNDEDSTFLAGMERDRSWDGGVEFSHATGWGEWTLEALTDIGGVHHGQELTLSWGYPFRRGAWWIKPWLGVNWQSADLANFYFGVNPDEAVSGRPAYQPGAVTQGMAGVDLSYRLARHHYLSLNLDVTDYASAISNSPIVDEDTVYQAALIYRYEFNDDLYAPPASVWPTDGRDRPRSVRIAAGCGTETSMNQIMRLQIDCEERHTGIASLFVGQQLSDTFFGFPWEIWVKGGVARHFERGEQGDFNEYVMAIKTYFSAFPWSDRLQTRFGFAEGLSYAAKIPTLERENVESKNRSASHLLNYLDWSLDVNVNDLIGQRSEKPCYLGFSIHHRSGIFGSSDLFGNVDGGSNFNTLYLECLY